MQGFFVPASGTKNRLSTYIKCKEVRTINGENIQNLFAGNIRKLLIEARPDYEKLYEIRLRVGRPLFLVYAGGERFLQIKRGEPYFVTRQDLKETLEYVCGYSLYAYEDEIRQGYISVQGGHRVGVTGKVLLNGDRIRGMKYISCINVRLAHQLPGCADVVMPYIQSRDHISHTLIVSPPRCGKTTLLRDVIRQLSNGREGIPGVTVGVVDERSELAGSWQGVPQNDLGMRTDILDACPKAEGMQMLVRSMSPDVVAVDELGKEEDFRAVESVIHCGCRLIATAHGNSVEDILNQPFFQKLKKMEIFEKYIVLADQKQTGRIKGIYDANYYQPILGWIMVLAEFAFCIREPYVNMAYVANKFKEVSKYAYIEAGINIVLSTILVIKFGIIGVAIATFIAMIYRTLAHII